jgi:cytochrome c oxidase assembly protein Cox11
MYKDLGFIWFVVKDFLKVGAFMAWFVSMVGMHFAPSPYNMVCFVIAVSGFVYLWVPLTRDVLKYKYDEYRKKKEAAWDVLKDSK